MNRYQDTMKVFDSVNRLSRRLFDNYFKDSILTSMQANILQYLFVEGTNKEICQKDIKNYLDIKDSSVNSLLNGLESKGYIRRVVGEDKRYRQIKLTEKSLAIRDEVGSQVDDYMTKIFEGIDDEELAELKRILIKMRNNME